MLYAYDLSNGMAKTLSQTLFGTEVEGIWHTSIVLFGQEFYYGGGICIDFQNASPYGKPMLVFNMGRTSRTQEEFLNFLECISYKYTLEAYHLLKHNCNHFTDECCRFLVESPIPPKIKNLPEELMSTPQGKALEPLINSFMQIKNSNVLPVVDRYKEFVTHEDLFAGHFCITGYYELSEFSNRGGVVIYWDPSDEMSLTLGETVNDLSGVCNIGLVDCLRHSYLRPDTVPFFRVFVEGQEVLEASSIEEVGESKEIITDLFRGHSNS